MTRMRIIIREEAEEHQQYGSRTRGMVGSAHFCRALERNGRYQHHHPQPNLVIPPAQDAVEGFAKSLDHAFWQQRREHHCKNMQHCAFSCMKISTLEMNVIHAACCIQVKPLLSFVTKRSAADKEGSNMKLTKQ